MYAGVKPYSHAPGTRSQEVGNDCQTISRRFQLVPKYGHRLGTCIKWKNTGWSRPPESKFDPTWSISTLRDLVFLKSRRLLTVKLESIIDIDMATASTINRVLLHPEVFTVGSQLSAGGYVTKDLAKVFVKTFQEDGNQQFSIDFDDAWRWLRFSRKDNALRALQNHFRLNSDYTFEAGQVRLEMKGSMTPDKYFLSTDTFEKFALNSRGAKGDIIRRFFLAIKKAYFEVTEELEDNPTPPVIDNILKRKRKLIDEQLQELEKETADPVRMEAKVRDALALKLGASTEVKCEYGMVDILSSDEVIEVKAFARWKHALGQCMAYGICFPRHQLRMHLYTGSEGVDPTRLDQVRQACSRFDVAVTLATDEERGEPHHTMLTPSIVDDTIIQDKVIDVPNLESKEASLEVAASIECPLSEVRACVELANSRNPLPNVAAVLNHFIMTSCDISPRLTINSRRFLAKLLEGVAEQDVEFFKPRVVGIFLSKLFSQVELSDGEFRGRSFRGLALKPSVA
jgi:hypothetical protein